MTKIFLILAIMFVGAPAFAKSLVSPDGRFTLTYDEAEFLDVEWLSIAPTDVLFKVGDVESFVEIHFEAESDTVAEIAMESLDDQSSTVVFEDFGGVQGVYIRSLKEEQYVHRYVFETEVNGRAFTIALYEKSYLAAKNVEALRLYDGLKRSVQIAPVNASEQ